MYKTERNAEENAMIEKVVEKLDEALAIFVSKESGICHIPSDCETCPLCKTIKDDYFEDEITLCQFMRMYMDSK